MSGVDGNITNVTITEETEGAIYTDGSRREGQTAAATTKNSWYLGEMATVMDAEMLGIAMERSEWQRIARER